MTTRNPSENERPASVDERIRTTFRAQLDVEQARLANGVIGPETAAAPHRSPGGGSGRLLLAAATAIVIVAAVGLGLLLRRQDDGQRLDTADQVDDGSGPVTTTTVDPTTAPTTTIAGQTTTGPAADGADGSDGGDDEAASPVEERAQDGFIGDNGFAVAMTEDEGEVSFVAIDLASGEEVATFHSAFLEATWYSPFQLSPAGDAIYLTQGFEDYWYSCDSFLPDLLRIDLDPAAVSTTEAGIGPVVIGQGLEPQISPDGTRLAYLTASDCVPDPEDPGNWVVAALDTIAVRDLVTGEERRWTAGGIVEAVVAGGDYREVELGGLVWLGDERLATSGGEILSAADLTSTGERLAILAETGTQYRSVGYDQTTGAVVIERVAFEDDSRPFGQAVAVDSVTGEQVVLAATTPSEWASNPIGLDATGRHLIVADVDGLRLPDGSVVTTTSRLASVDW